MLIGSIYTVLLRYLRILQDNVKGAESMLLFDVIDKYEGKYRMIII